MRATSLHPDPDGPARVARQVTDALASMPFVRKVAVFGSLATDTADRWSDVDMIVACDDADAGQWYASAAIRDAKPVLFYRTFYSFNVPQPSGRYWFADESPFHRLDVSFHSAEEYDQLMCEPSRFGHDVSYREMHSTTPSTDGAGTVLPHACPISVGDRERDLGGCVYTLLERVKSYLRGAKPITEVHAAVDRLRTSLADISLDTVMQGGRIGRLAYETLGFAKELLGSRGDEHGQDRTHWPNE